ncbi:MAG: DUF159 family protein [Gemmatales bacterium]|nr:MAG: DUF159 family protein [Gemmatales bacterium]
MCGRYTLRATPAAIAKEFGLSNVPPLSPRYNIAPTQNVPVVRLAGNTGPRELALLRWGLIPSWATDLSIGNRLINARSETAADKPAFRAAFRKRRCLVVADGFYEWKKTDGKKQPYFIKRCDDRPFAFAGLWESCPHNDERIETCTILTTAANDWMKPLHDRMPVILPPERYDRWLDPTIEQPDELRSLLRPIALEELEAYPVSTLVNNPRFDSPRCVEPFPMKE